MKVLTKKERITLVNILNRENKSLRSRFDEARNKSDEKFFMLKLNQLSAIRNKLIG